jgi:hypothetical protein
MMHYPRGLMELPPTRQQDSTHATIWFFSIKAHYQNGHICRISNFVKHQNGHFDSCGGNKMAISMRGHHQNGYLHAIMTVSTTSKKIR